jgi:hypothetical protein
MAQRWPIALPPLSVWTCASLLPTFLPTGYLPSSQARANLRGIEARGWPRTWGVLPGLSCALCRRLVPTGWAKS